MILNRFKFLRRPWKNTDVIEKNSVLTAGKALKSQLIGAEEHELIELIIAFGETLVREVMTPRPDVVSVSGDFTVSAAMEVAVLNGFSRVPVTGESLDEITGVLHVKEMIEVQLDGGGDKRVETLARLPQFIPETKKAGILLREMQSNHYHLAVVVDEYGGTAGIVTLEDLLEELVGEIVDEFDSEEVLAEPLIGGGLRVHGRMPVDELNELLGGVLPNGDWDTLGGLIFDALGHAPVAGEAVDIASNNFIVERVAGRRITQVRITTPTNNG
tara:strand:- start:12 stop:827 length:816 start_codon:yes stop_codon:yes gene_type:complete